MILVADSGSTKADWALLQGSAVPVIYHTAGINPTFHDEEFILQTLSGESELRKMAKLIRKVHFFGAGCSSDERCELVKRALQKFFPEAEVEVEHDVMAAVLATCGDHPGIACIIGTGSNACFFDGTKIEHNNYGLGHILGDEASGSYLGKKLVTLFLYHLMPDDLARSFEKKYHLTRDELIVNVYNRPGANVYLASFAAFLSEHKEHPWIVDLIREGFETFINLYVVNTEGYKKLPVHFVGSIAYHYSNILKDVLKKKKLIAGKIIQKPIEELAAYYHVKENADDF